MIIIMLTWSMKQPSSISTASIPTSTASGARSAPITTRASPVDASEKARIWEKVTEPQMMNRVMTVKRRVWRIATRKLSQVRRR